MQYLNNEKMRSINFRSWIYPGIFLVVAAVSYGIYVPWFGIYGDDWTHLWTYHLFGPAGFIPFVSADRPFSAWLYLLITPIFGEVVWPYHLLLVILRWVCACLLFWILKKVWPDKTREVTWVALLFTVFPMFQQQAQPWAFLLHFSVLSLLLFSLGAMISALGSSGWKYWLLNVMAVATSPSMFSLEYFVGMEFLRPVLLFIALRDRSLKLSKRITRVFMYWIPYLIVLALFVIWRVFIFKFRHYQPQLADNIQAAPVDTLSQLVWRVFTDAKLMLIDGWRQIFTRLVGTDGSYFGLVAGVIIVLSALFIILNRKSKTGAIPVQIWKEWPVQAILLGLFSFLVSGLPIWVVNLPLELAFPWDRASLPFMVGVSLVIVGVILLVVQYRFQVFVLSCIIGLAVGFHYQNALVYRQEFENQRNYFWQMVWRIPGLKPGTIILSSAIPLYRVNDNNLTPILNWTYAPENRSNIAFYKFFDLDVRLGSTIPELKPGIEISHNYREINFTGNTDNSLVIYYNLNGCLRVIGPEDVSIPGIPDKISKAAKLSKLDQIVVDAEPKATPPAAIGSEPAHEWCYYFEKADLARQQKDWIKIVELGNQVTTLGLNASNGSELIPFIEGYVYTGDWVQAEKFTTQALSDSNFQESICRIWQTINNNLPSNPVSKKILGSEPCTQ